MESTANFSGAVLAQANFDSATLLEGTFSGADLTGATFDAATITALWDGATCPDASAATDNAESCCGHLNGSVATSCSVVP